MLHKSQTSQHNIKLLINSMLREISQQSMQHDADFSPLCLDKNNCVSLEFSNAHEITLEVLEHRDLVRLCAVIRTVGPDQTNVLLSALQSNLFDTSLENAWIAYDDAMGALVLCTYGTQMHYLDGFIGTINALLEAVEQLRDGLFPVAGNARSSVDPEKDHKINEWLRL